MDCYSAGDLDILAANQQVVARQISQWGWDSYNPKREEPKNTILQDTNYVRALDSMFSVVKEFLVDQIGEEAFCKRAKYNWLNLSYTNYKKEMISGEFRFQVFYDSIVCWTGGSVTVRFSFKETEKGKYEMKYPRPLPSSILEGRRPKLATADVVSKAMEMGLIDGTENIKIERGGEWNMESLLTIYDFFAYQRKIYFDNQTGELLRDTLIDVFKAHRRKSFVDYLEEAEKVVDATCVKTEEFKDADNHHTYTNYFFKTHHVMKGGKMNPSFVITSFGGASQLQTTHGGNNMPAPGTRSLLFLKSENPELTKVVANSVDRNAYGAWSITTRPNTQVIGTRANLYTDVFSTITKSANSKIITYETANQTDQETKDWLNENGRAGLSDKEGSLIGFNHLSWSEDNKDLSTDIFMIGTKDYSYLLCHEFLINYDTNFVSPFAAKAGVVSASRFYSFNSGIPTAKLSENYNIKITDVSHNQILVKIKAKNKKDLMQISPARTPGGSINLYHHVLAELIFTLKKEPSSGTFQLSLENKPFQKTGRYYDPIKKKKKKYAFQRILKPTVKRDMDSGNPIIEKVWPLSYTIGDTINIVGQCLEAYQNQIHLTCGVTERGIVFERHCLVPRKYVVFAGEKLLRFVVPEVLGFRQDDLKGMRPIDGTVKVKNVQSGEELAFFEKE